jgi:drug/metabolite transporter (DMT)-like permease
LDNPSHRRGFAIVAMALSPLLFSLNLIFGRLTGAEVAPFTLAFIRWATVAAILAPFVLGAGRPSARIIRARLPIILVLGFLGMWACGGPVYLAMQLTSATNGALIFAVTPVVIILIEAVFRGRIIGWREGLGSALALTGAVVIVLRGDLAALIDMTFNAGDLILVGTMLAWALYSIICRTPLLAGLPNIGLLFGAAASGAVLLAPFALAEFLSGAPMPVTASAFAGIAGIILFPSLLAYSAHQFGMRVLGPSFASIFMYLLPPYGVGLALLILGEPFGAYQAVGIALVMAGVILATLPVQYAQLVFGGSRAD